MREGGGVWVRLHARTDQLLCVVVSACLEDVHAVDQVNSPSALLVQVHAWQPVCALDQRLQCMEVRAMTAKQWGAHSHGGLNCETSWLCIDSNQSLQSHVGEQGWGNFAPWCGFVAMYCHGQRDVSPPHLLHGGWVEQGPAVLFRHSAGQQAHSPCHHWRCHTGPCTM